MLWFVNSSDPAAQIRQGLQHDPAAAGALAAALCPDMTTVPTGETTLTAAATPADDQLFVGVYGALAVVTSPVLATSTPSTLPEAWISALPAEVTIMLHTDPATSLGAFARWEAGELRRSFSANPVDILENNGLPFIFEGSFWAGEHPLVYAEGAQPDPQALPFHPQEFAEQAIREWLGFRFTTPLDSTDTDPATITVSGFAIRPKGYEPTEADVELGLSNTDVPTRNGPASNAPGSNRPESGAPEGSEAHAPGRVARWFGFGNKS
jgi:hypothetical protein